MNTIINDIDSTTGRFEELYLALRAKERRIHTDAALMQLPLVEPGHPHFDEWRIRKRSADKLVRYLENKKRSLSILENGCGNGWLSAKLATISNSIVTGTDINNTELQQAKRVFAKKHNLLFSTQPPLYKKFDAIIFAASIQYFQPLHKALYNALSHLNPGGEIHIIGSHFYPHSEISAARTRSQEYYRSLGFSEFADYYFHHSFESLKEFNYKLLSDPTSRLQKLLGKHDPFPWICISNT